MRFVSTAVLCFLLTLAYAGCRGPHGDGDTLYQVSTIDALLTGEYDGAVSVAELQKHGQVGLGTFDGLDGEMIAVDGRFYQVRVDGHAYQASERVTVPFAAVTRFETDEEMRLRSIESFEELAQVLDNSISSPNAVYAIRIEGEFEYVRARSVPRQGRPYRPLAEVVEEQKSFPFRSVRGTMVGFRCPEALRGVNVPGYHLHFVNATRTRGGHVLDCRIKEAVVHLDYTDEVHVTLPHTKAFRASVGSGDMEKVER